MTIDPKALEMIQATAVKANGQRVFMAPAEPPHVYYLEDQGKILRVEAQAKPANDSHLTIQSLCDWIKDCPDGECEIWIGDRGVCATSGRDFAKYVYELSDQFNTLRQWSTLGNATKDLTQKELYRLIKTLFRGCLPDEPTLASKIGKVDIKKAQQATGEVTTSKVSLSRSMMAEVAGTDALPETLKFKVPLFKTSPLDKTVSVQAAFDLDPETEVFRITILPGEIDNAIHQGRIYLRGLIDARLKENNQSEHVAIYYGEPSKP